jgi:predicted O-methyltransferase YrrM
MDEINQIKNFANQTLVPIVKDDGLSFILDYIKENNVKLILEIGTAIGYSSIKFAQVNPDVRVYTIEFDIDRYQQAIKNVNDCNLGEQITVFLGDAMAFDFDDKFDMIFIDGPKAQYINFFEKFKKRTQLPRSRMREFSCRYLLFEEWLGNDAPKRRLSEWFVVLL